MEFRPLGRTDLNVSSLCLGTMTWGEQNTEADAFAQIDMAKAAGINFIDTAEMYPVPPRPETYATTEQYIGTYFKSRGDRADWILQPRSPALATASATFATAVRDSTVSTFAPPLMTACADCKPTDRPLSAALAGTQHELFGRLGYQHLPDDDFTPLKKRLPPLMTKSERVESATLAFPTRPLGRHEVPSTGRDAQMAARRLDTEPLQPPQPQL